MKAIIASGALGLALVAAAGTPAQAADPPQQRTCFWTRDIQSHSFGGPGTIYLRVRSKDVYRLESKGNCTGSHLQGDPLIFDPAPQSGMVCSPLDLNLKIGRPGAGPATPCIIDSIHKMTPAEVAALPKGKAP